MSRRFTTMAGVLAIALGLTGCGLSVPEDPDGTLDRIEEDGVLRAGASADQQAVGRSEDDATGPLADLVEDFARQHDAEVEWAFGSEETLVADLEARELDVVVGGMTADTPWSERVGVSRGYPQLVDDDARELVFLVPMGQNRLLSELERFADEEVAR